MKTGGHGMMRKWDWGPAACTLKDMQVRTQHARFPSLSTQPNTS